MLIKLIRNKPSGKAIFGRLLVDCENVSGFQSFKLQMDTLENTDYAIPSGFYRLRLTYSPRFKEILPILDGVWGFRCSYLGKTSNEYLLNANGQEVRGSGVNSELLNSKASELPNSKASEPRSQLRSGIRIHAGNTIDHTEGCILVGSADLPNRRLLSSRKALNQLRDYLLNYMNQNPNEEVYIEISEPDAYPLYDVPYERRLQKP